MVKQIHYGNIGCRITTSDKTVLETGGLPLDPRVLEYAAWRWLYRCQPLQGPLCRMSLRFRLGCTRRKSMRLAVTVPAQAAGLPGDGWLHLLLVVSGEVLIASAGCSQCSTPAGLSRRIRRVVFH